MGALADTQNNLMSTALRGHSEGAVRSTACEATARERGSRSTACRCRGRASAARPCDRGPGARAPFSAPGPRATSPARDQRRQRSAPPAELSVSHAEFGHEKLSIRNRLKQSSTKGPASARPLDVRAPPRHIGPDHCRNAGPGGEAVRRDVLWVVLCGLSAVLSCGCAGNPGGDDGRAPGAPTGVTAQAGSATSVHVMWNAVAADPAVGAYEVYRGTEKVGDVPGSAHMLDVVRLSPSTTYVFSVRARDGDGRLGPRSREARATTPAAAAADNSPPTTPGTLTGRTTGSRAVQLSWSASTDDRKVVSYDVCQGGVRVHSVGGGQTATVVTGLRPGARYSFTVRARDAADNVSPAGPPVRLTTAPGDGGGRTPRRSASGRPPTSPAGRTTSTCPGWRPAWTGWSRSTRSSSTGSRPPHWCGAGPLREGGRRTASTWAGRKGPPTGCGCGPGCRTARGARSRRNAR